MAMSFVPFSGITGKVNPVIAQEGRMGEKVSNIFSLLPFAAVPDLELLAQIKHFSAPVKVFPC